MTSSRHASDRSLTVLVVSSSQDLGGAEFVLLDAIAALRARGVSVSVLNLVSQPGELARTLRAQGVAVSGCRIGRFRDPVGAARVLRWFLAHAPAFQLALANDTRALLYAALGCTVLRRPYIWYVHDYIRGATPFENAARWVRPTLHIAVSDAVRRTLLEHGCPGERIRVVHNAIDVERFTPAVDGGPVRAELGLDANALVIGSLGRIEPLKAVEVLLDAAATLRSSLPAATYLVVGDVVTDVAHREEALRYRESLRARRDRLGLATRVKFLGHRGDVPRILAALDVLVHTSTQESFGRVLIEAMAAGRPVVASRAGGMPEIVDDGVTGYLIPPRDASALASRLDALADPARRARMGRAARARVTERFALPRFGAEMGAAVGDALRRDG